MSKFPFITSLTKSKMENGYDKEKTFL